jgi:hypothetical protein
MNIMFENAKKYNRPDSRLYKVRIHFAETGFTGVSCLMFHVAQIVFYPDLLYLHIGNGDF